MPLRVLVAGKGGVGKTTVSALLSRFLSSELGMRVLAVDTDSVPNLALALGVPRERANSMVPLVRNADLVEERTGARPGEGWGVFFRLNPDVGDLVDRYGVRVSDGVDLLVVGSIDSAKQGCLCPAIALAKALLRHLMLREGEAVVVDSEAGAEVFGRGLAENFDRMICVSEPTVKSLDISEKLMEMGRQLGIAEVTLLVNKFPGGGGLKRAIEERFGRGGREVFFVPHDPAFVRAEMEGRGVDSLPPDSPGVSALREAFRAMFGVG